MSQELECLASYWSSHFPLSMYLNCMRHQPLATTQLFLGASTLPVLMLGGIPFLSYFCKLFIELVEVRLCPALSDSMLHKAVTLRLCLAWETCIYKRVLATFPVQMWDQNDCALCYGCELYSLTSIIYNAQINSVKSTLPMLVSRQIRAIYEITGILNNHKIKTKSKDLPNMPNDGGIGSPWYRLHKEEGISHCKGNGPHQPVIGLPALCNDGLTGRELPTGWGPCYWQSLLECLSVLLLTLNFVSMASIFSHLASLALLLTQPAWIAASSAADHRLCLWPPCSHTLPL